MPNWQAQLEADTQHARTMLRVCGNVNPMFALHTDAGISLIGTGWSNTKEKRIAQQLVMLLAIAEGANAITFISEAWLREESIDAMERREVLIVSLTYRENEKLHSIMSVMDIMRDDAGEVLDAVPEATPTTALEGVMLELLLPATPPPDVRAGARIAYERLAKELSIEVRGVNINPGVVH